MAPKQQKTLQQCLTGEKWYECPLPFAIFVVFLILFAYAIYILIACSGLIREHSQNGDAAFEEKYGKSITDITKVYVINMVVMILSLIVLVFFLHKAIPVGNQVLLFNEYLGMFIVLFIFVVSAWTLAVFNSIGTKNPMPVAQYFTATILFVSLAGLCMYGYQVYQAHQIAAGAAPAPAPLAGG